MEEWRDISDYQGYQVSYTKQVRNKKKGNILKQIRKSNRRYTYIGSRCLSVDTLFYSAFPECIPDNCLPGEVWEDIPGFPGYQASTLGRIKSFCDKHSGIRKESSIVHQAVAHHGYRRLQICRDAKRINYYVHRLVLLTFVGPIPDGMEVGHLNGDTSDNRLENLCYCTKEENEALKVQTGTHHWVKLTPEQAGFIKKNYSCVADGGIYTASKLAEMFNVSKECIHGIIQGRSWRHLTNY